MANYTTTANVILSVNGRQAEKMLAKMQQEAAKLEKKLAAAATAGDKATMKKLQRELNSTNNVIKQIQGSASTVEQTLLRLDRATPRDLNKALRTLQTQLNGIQRGSEAWNAHVAKIQAVKAELQKVNASLATQKSMWSRMNNWINSTQTAIMGVVAAFAGLVLAGRKAVNHFAEMEEAIANTRKFTRMTEEDVRSLNKAFLETDTRLARTELNLLAQEGGRLGYNTLKTVGEYVKAASVIKVALVDLGEGATQTIAKISNIFGVEEIYGVEKAMLKVGSTVNHLSQNCTASKPYIVEFAQRMAGIGSTAKMTIPDIMAFAATLDAHGQKVEMSASALSRLIMKLFQDPEDVAKRTGMNVKYFMKILNNDVTSGVMMFLEQLAKIGEKDALAAIAPLFKDLGMDGVRMAQVLSNLSSHLEFLKWQMGEANQAFREGTSASNEYAIFNNTVQAQLEKAKYRVYELSVTLGEKLMPVMKHIYTSSSLFMRVLNYMVEFFIRNRTVILTLTTSIAAYYAAIGIARLKTMLFAAASGAATAASTAFTYAIGLARMPMMIYTQGLTGASRALKIFSSSLAMNPLGAFASIVATVTVAVVSLSDAFDNAGWRMSKARKKAQEFTEEAVRERTELDILFGTLKGAREGTEEYEKAKQTLIDQYGKYLSGLVDEKGHITDLEAAYERLSIAVERSVKIRGINSAKESILSEYSKETAELLSRLQNTLQAWTGDAKQAAEVTAQVSQALQNNTQIPLSAQKIIAEASRVSLPRKGMAYVAEWLGASELKYTPAEILHKLNFTRNRKDSEMEQLDVMHDNADPWRRVGRNELELSIRMLEKIVQDKVEGIAMRHTEKGIWESVTMSPTEAKALLEQYREVLALKGGPTPPKQKEPWRPYPDIRDNEDGGSGGASAKDRFKKEDEYRAQRQAYAAINKAVGQRLHTDANTGEKSWRPYTAYDYDRELADIDIKYYEKILQREDLTWLERLQMQAKYQEALAKKQQEYNEHSVELENQKNSRNLADIKQAYLDNLLTQEQYEQAVEDEDVRHLGKVAEIYRKLAFARQSEWEKNGSVGEKPAIDLDAYNKYVSANNAYLTRSAQIHNRKQTDAGKEAEAHQKELDRVRDRYFMPDEKRKADYESDMALLQEVYDAELVLAGDNADRKLELEKAYQLARVALAQKYGQQTIEGFEKYVRDSVEWLESDGGKALTGTLSTLSQGLSDIFSEATSIIKAELEIQTAAIEKRYDSEIIYAEGNSYRIAKLERDKQEQLAKAKNEANRKMFAMQVIQAVAQTATNALSAYGSAAAVPVIGYILAPVAAAMALASGMLQVAAIKKQQQASEAKGYAEGGFTRQGAKYEPAGVVHAGEWVASQKLVNSPRTRPLIDALEYAQRNNTIGSLSMADVSRSITAPVLLANSNSASQPPVVNVNFPQETTDNSKLQSAIDRLNQRLNEPFVTVNTVAGDHGIQRAQLEYERLIKNKSPKK